LITFDYQGYPVDDPDRPDAIALRPMIRVWLGGPKRVPEQLGLIDTGSDDVLIPEYLGVQLGFTFPETGKVRLGGLLGSVRASARRINLLITDGQTPLIWSARALFHDGRPDRLLLGHAGFLEHFTVGFDGRRHCVSLQPNGTFPEPILRF
jgi:hypothetical protein